MRSGHSRRAFYAKFGRPPTLSSRGAKRRGIYHATHVASRDYRTVDPSLTRGMTTSTLEITINFGTARAALWRIAVIALVQRRSAGPAFFALLWGLLVAALGFMQQSILVGELHWIVRVLHLVIGLASVSIAERLAPKPVTATVTA